MSVFKKVRLKDVCKVISGYAFKSSSFKVGGNTPVIKIKNIKIGTATLEDADYVNSIFLEKIHDKYKVTTDDILISLTGSHITQPESVVGRVGKYPNKYPIAILNQRAGKIIPNEELIDKNYLFYSLLGDDVRKEIAQMAHGAASQANVSPTQVESVEIRLPCLKVQKKIGHILLNYDSLVENNNRRIAILEEMAQSLYREWFVNFRYPNHEESLDADGEQKLIDSPLGPIPEGWGIKCLKDIGFINTGKTPSKAKEENYNSRDVPFIKTPDMHRGMFVINTQEMLSTVGADSQKSKYIPSWAICVSCIGTAGIVALSSQISQTNQQINTLIPEFKEHTEFMYFALKSLKKTIENYGATGATMTNLSKGKFEALEIIFPENSMLVKFHQLANPIFKKIQILSRKNENLKQQQDMLLPKLISGQIELRD